MLWPKGDPLHTNTGILRRNEIGIIVVLYTLLPSPLQTPFARLVHAMAAPTISAMHAPRARSLETRPPGQASSQFHEGAADLVARANAALVVAGSTGVLGVDLLLGGCGGCGSCGGRGVMSDFGAWRTRGCSRGASVTATEALHHLSCC
jgi:hypothetical protein